MQCKDIPDIPILEFLAKLDRWCNWFEPEQYENSVRRAMPADVPEKLSLAKMRQLIKRGLVEGCPCGCRGDFELTPRGAEFVKEHHAQSEEQSRSGHGRAAANGR